MKPLENLNFNKKEVIRPQSVEQKLEEAIKDFESSKTYSAKEVREFLSKKIWNRFIISDIQRQQ